MNCCSNRLLLLLLQQTGLLGLPCGAAALSSDVFCGACAATAAPSLPPVAAAAAISSHAAAAAAAVEPSSPPPAATVAHTRFFCSAAAAAAVGPLHAATETAEKVRRPHTLLLLQETLLRLRVAAQAQQPQQRRDRPSRLPRERSGRYQATRNGQSFDFFHAALQQHSPQQRRLRRHPRQQETRKMQQLIQKL